MVCPEVGRVETFMQSSQALEQWMEDANTDPDLVECIMKYVQGRGSGHNGIGCAERTCTVSSLRMLTG